MSTEFSGVPKGRACVNRYNDRPLSSEFGTH
jgi:hypothetical protein